MKKQLVSRLSQAQMNKLISQMFKSYKAYHAKVREYSKKGKDVDEIPDPVYLANEELNKVLIPCLVHLEEVELYIQRNDEKWEGKLKALGEAYIERIIEYVADENAKVFAHLFIHNGSNVGDVDNLGDDHEDDDE